MLELEATAHVARKWMSGRQTQFPQLILLTLATQSHKRDAMEMHAEVHTPRPDTQEPVILMDAISTLTEWVTLHSMATA